MDKTFLLRRVKNGLPVFVRYWAGTLFVIYAAPKLMGTQFRVLESIYDTPLGKVGDFWLAWSFFGRSYEYQMLLGVAELTVGILFLIPRTKTLGALFSLPITVNILMVDYFFNVALGALFVAVTLLIGAVYLLVPEIGRLKLFLWDEQKGASSLGTFAARFAYSAAVLAVMSGVLAHSRQLFPANYGGVYKIERYSKNGAAQLLGPGEYGTGPMLYLEIRNTVVLSLNGRNTTGRYTIDPDGREFAWTLQSDEPDREVKGTYQVNGDELTLTGRSGSDSVEFVLKRLDREKL